MIVWNLFEIVSTSILLIITISFFLFTLHIKKKHSFKLRGIIKNIFYTKIIPEPEIQAANRWIITAILYSLIPTIWIAILTYRTDYSFLILLFPIIWYYYFLRFLFWEKSDLEEDK